MKITIGIPVRNGEPYLRQAIESAVRQSRSADQILVIDDASSDQTAAIARSAEWEGRVEYRFNGNPSGFADAFNRLAHLATGDYLCILCADDLLDRDCLAVLEEGISRFPSANFCHAGFRYIRSTGEAISASPTPHSRKGELVPGDVYSRDLLKGVEEGADVHRCIGFLVSVNLMRTDCPFRREAGLIADTDFLLRVASRTDVVRITQPLASVRIHSESVSNRVESLALQLAEDYLFQIGHSQSVVANPENRERLERLAGRFVDQLFVQAVRAGRTDFLERAFELQKRFALLTNRPPPRLERRKTILWRNARTSAPVAALLRGVVATIAHLRKLREKARG